VETQPCCAALRHEASGPHTTFDEVLVVPESSPSLSSDEAARTRDYGAFNEMVWERYESITSLSKLSR
jgi:hypothetical protein